jgi:predicted O-methyltransferase YrrM
MAVRYPLPHVAPGDLFPELSQTVVLIAPLQDGIVVGDSGVAKLALVSGLAKARGAKRILEIGTASGFMARHLALNCGPDSRVWTLDLQEDAADATRFQLLRVDRDIVKKGPRGSPPAGWYAARAPEADRIIQLFGDSARFDFSSVEVPLDFAFIDGAHSYEYVISDSVNVLLRMRPAGVVIWDDYLHYWPGLMRALGELDAIIRINPLSGTGLAVAVTPKDWFTDDQRMALESLRADL